MNKDTITLTLFSDTAAEENSSVCNEALSDAEEIQGASVFDDTHTEAGGDDTAETTDIGNYPDSEKSIIARLLGYDDIADSEANGDELIDRIFRKRIISVIEDGIRERHAGREYERLLHEAEILSARSPSFDLAKEAADPRFIKLIASGFTLEDAWYAMHVKEFIEAVRRDSFEKARLAAYEKLDEVSARPDENGASMRAAAKRDSSVENLSGKGIRDILRRVEKGAKIKL